MSLGNLKNKRLKLSLYMFRAICGFAHSIDSVARSVENNIESIGLGQGLGLHQSKSLG